MEVTRHTYQTGSNQRLFLATKENASFIRFGQEILQPHRWLNFGWKGIIVGCLRNSLHTCSVYGISVIRQYIEVLINNAVLMRMTKWPPSDLYPVSGGV